MNEAGLGRRGAPLEQADAAALFLHGRGRSTEDVLLLAERLGLPGLACLAAAAPAGTWYPEGFMAPVERNQPHLDRALARLDALVVALGEKGHPPERIAWVGFSQGACLACEYVLRHPRRWGALVAFTGGVIGPAGIPLAPTGDLAGTPVLLATADPDPWVPVSRVSETARLFRAMNGVVAEQVYPGLGHEVSDDEIRAARALLSPWLTGAGAAR